jgi:hypothetical protein
LGISEWEKCYFIQEDLREVFLTVGHLSRDWKEAGKGARRILGKDCPGQRVK